MNVAHENQVPWPAERGVTASRKSGPFRTNMVDACERIEREVSAFTRAGRNWRTRNLTIYAECQLGAKLRFLANQRGLLDPRVAVEFDLDGQTYNICADRYIEPWQNLCGIAEYIKAIRAQERNGIFTAAEMFASFASLPSGRDRHWSEVLMVPRDATRETIDRAYRDLVKRLHPDVGGNSDDMAALNVAYDQAKAEVGS